MNTFLSNRTVGAVVMLYLLSGCYYDKEELLYPGGADCNDIVQPAFSKDILPLLNLKCNNCHKGNYASGGIRLDSYDQVMTSVNNGGLMGSVSHTSGYSAMPKNGSKMSGCEINKIQAWIDAGALNN